MTLFSDFSNFSLMTDDVEFSRYYELYTADDGTEYIQEISERTFEKRCINIYEVITCFQHQGRAYVIVKDSEENVYFNEYQRADKNKIKLLSVEEKLMQRLIREYW